MTPAPRPLLVADIGGTNARFALGAGEGARLRLHAVRAYSESFDSAEAAIARYLADAGAAPAPEAVALSLAGPVEGDRARLTNRPWLVTADGARRASGAARAVLLNDFAAAALSLPFLPPADFIPLGGPAPAPDLWRRDDLRVCALGPGTGLGCAMLVRAGGALRALDTEAGHIGFAPTDDAEWAVARAMIARFGRCTLEHLLSGPGLLNLYRALGGAAAAGPEQVPALAAQGDETARRAETMFCRILGASAGDLAMATGARHGVFVLGGVAAALADRLTAGDFRARFEDKGDYARYVGPIPTLLAPGGHAGLIGAAAALRPDAESIVLRDDAP